VGKARKLATIDSGVYNQTFYGILNGQGDFWTPLAFPTEHAADTHLRMFWAGDPENWSLVQRTHKIVPVRIRLNQLANPTAKEPVDGTGGRDG
jgi:hypothetical protein